MAELKGWKDIPIGGLVVEPGSAKKYQTGTWRVLRPIFQSANCINCMFCWLYCPDQSIVVELVDGKPKMKGFDYYSCKGCGLCANVCPKNIDPKTKQPAADEKKAIIMKPETDFVEE
ncbi:MAG TPA: 4Fe-4S binding protein [Fervidobacterium sp.]|nr:4Fe-4S binding protein [Fervidobacterium sp.]